MPTTRKSPARSRKVTLAPAFTRTRDFLTRYALVTDDQADVCSLYVMATHCFSPRTTWPQTFGYLYVTGGTGSGKTTFGQSAIGALTRLTRKTVGLTGAGLFRLQAEFDDETGEVSNLAPTLILDEIDATYNGPKNEMLRQMLDAGTTNGATVPRPVGKKTIEYPVFGPKILIGIDNGHLPDTVTNRSIRIDVVRHTPAELKAAGVEPLYSFEIEDEAAEIQQQLADWALQNSMVFRDYRPEAIEGISARQWETVRSLVQVAHALGIEDRIREALKRIVTANPEKPSDKVLLYTSIQKLFDTTGLDRVTSRQLWEWLQADGVAMPGTSPKAVSSMLADDGIGPDYVRIPADHPAYDDSRSKAFHGGKYGQSVRGYYRRHFDPAIVRYLATDDEL